MKRVLNGLKASSTLYKSGVSSPRAVERDAGTQVGTNLVKGTLDSVIRQCCSEFLVLEFCKTELDFCERSHDPVVRSDHFCGGTASDHDVRERHLNYFG